MYTEMFINVDLEKETPDEVIKVLKAMRGDGDELVLSKYPDRWQPLYAKYILSESHTLGNRALPRMPPHIKGGKRNFIGYIRGKESQCPEIIHFSASAH